MAYGGQYSTTITATSSGGAVAFVRADATGISLKATAVLVINDGSSNAVYFNFTTTSGATTDAYAVKAGESTSISARQGHYTGLSYATTGVGSVACRILATR